MSASGQQNSNTRPTLSIDQIKTVDSDGFTALHRAVKGNDIETVKTIIAVLEEAKDSTVLNLPVKPGPGDQQPPDAGSTALHLIAAQQVGKTAIRTEIAEVLIAAGASLFQINFCNQTTALNLAITIGNIKIAYLLIDAMISKASTHQSNKVRTAITNAVKVLATQDLSEAENIIRAYPHWINTKDLDTIKSLKESNVIAYANISQAYLKELHELKNQFNEFIKQNTQVQPEEEHKEVQEKNIIGIFNQELQKFIDLIFIKLEKNARTERDIPHSPGGKKEMSIDALLNYQKSMLKDLKVLLHELDKVKEELTNNNIAIREAAKDKVDQIIAILQSTQTPLSLPLRLINLLNPKLQEYGGIFKPIQKQNPIENNPSLPINKPKIG